MKPDAQIKSENVLDIATTIPEDSSISLLSMFNSAIDCRVMLRVNLWIKGKLANGSLGTLKAIVYKHGIRPSELPFDEYRGKCIYNKCFQIIPISKSFMKRGMTCYRKQ